MSWPATTWGPSGLSPNRNLSVFDSTDSLDGTWTNGRPDTQLIKVPINYSNLHRPRSGSTLLPPIYGPIGLRPPAMVPMRTGIASAASKGMNCQYSYLPRSAIHLDAPSMAPHNLASPLETSYFGSPNVQNLKINRALQPFDGVPYSSPAISPHQPVVSLPPVNPNYCLPKRSKAALAAEDSDHPSFARPPHRAIEPAVEKEINGSWPPVADQYDSDHTQDLSPMIVAGFQSYQAKEDDEPLVPNFYPVPPPPPYPQSAAPMSGLAADMVWERCYFPQSRHAGSTSSLAPLIWDCTFPWSTPSHSNHSNVSSASSNWTGSVNTFGAIGAEAKARRFNRQYHTSVSPSNLGNTHLPPPPGRRSSTAAKTEVTPAFKRWVHQVLEHTLLSPQVLILALYYVDCVVGTDIFGDGPSKMSLLPYKVLLAALVVANKTLDDHSYRNSTFANVSSMTNFEVNSVEVALLRALNFNVVPSIAQWAIWLKEVTHTGERSGFVVPDVGPRSPVLPCQSYSQIPSEQHSQPQPTIGRGSIFDQAPPTSDFSWHSHIDSAVVDNAKPQGVASSSSFKSDWQGSFLHHASSQFEPSSCQGGLFFETGSSHRPNNLGPRTYPVYR